MIRGGVGSQGARGGLGAIDGAAAVPPVSLRRFRAFDPGGAFVNNVTRVNLAGWNGANSNAGYFAGQSAGALGGNVGGQMLYAIPDYFEDEPAVTINRLLTRTNAVSGVLGAGTPSVRLGVYREGVRTSGPLAGAPFPGDLLAQSAHLTPAGANVIMEDFAMSCSIAAGARVFFAWVCTPAFVSTVPPGAGFIVPAYRGGVLSAPLGFTMDPSTGAPTGDTDNLTAGCVWRHAFAYTGSEDLPDPFPQSAPVVQIDADKSTPCVFFGMQPA